MNSINKIKDNKDIFRRDNYEIISPYNSNYDIFNKKDFNIETFNRNGKRIILITRKDEEKINIKDTKTDTTTISGEAEKDIVRF